jgi:hypothetical protein
MAYALPMGEKKRKSTSVARDEIELHPDAWDRFTEFVKRIAKAGPQHRVKGASKDARSDRKRSPRPR